MTRNNLFAMKAFASVLTLMLSACAEDPLGGNDQTGEGHTITLHLSATVSPIQETKVTVQPAQPDSKATAKGFSYELVSSDADTPGFIFKPMPPKVDSSSINLITKAPNTLKNTYAILFTSSGAFNGRANIGTFTVGTDTDITFTNVTVPTASGCRLVIVANDNAAAIPYASSGGTGNFADFSNSYAAFQALTITSNVNQDADVPYAGSATINLSLSETGATVDVQLYRTLAKITLNNTFNITDGPARSSLTLYNAGIRRFATPGNDNYNGTGTTLTTSYVGITAGSNTNSYTWYVGENIRPAGSGINSSVDRNSSKAPANACYIRIASATQSTAGNTYPTIGQEYIQPSSRAFTYDIYLGKSSVLSDFSLRRHTNYTIGSEISGTLAEQEELAAADERVTLTKTGGEPGGLAIGRFGGPVGYSSETEGSIPTGSYTKLLLLEPNTNRNLSIDNIYKSWGFEGTQYQPEARRSWDRTYIYNRVIDGTIGGMSTAADGLYAYCNELTLGGVSKGTWYVPTQVQLQMVWAVYSSLKGGPFENYGAFNEQEYRYYWSSTEATFASAFRVGFYKGNTENDSKEAGGYMRCVRDI